MRRTQIQLDDDVYLALRRNAFERGLSMAAVIRELLKERLRQKPMRRSAKDFTFVASGQGPSRRRPISEAHDEELAGTFSK